MKKKRFPRKTSSKKPSALPPTAEFTMPTDDDEELEAIHAYDSAKASGGTPIPYDHVLRKIEQTRKRAIRTS
ncbi:MAG: hypothetical protein ABSC10_08040 [Candidatus Acidiferrales bacterium]|jgi:hypothetical protein